jgi:single-stranded DNA-binding protein
MAIESEFQSRTYENKEGRKVTVWEAIVSNAYFCGDKQETSSAGSQDFIEIGVDDEDLPF